MWQFVLTDNTFTPVGEVLNAKSRQVTLGLNKIDTMSFVVRLDNPLANELASCAGYVKAYRDGDIMFHGPLISAEETGDANGGSIAINAAGIGWMLTKRLAGKSATGTVYSTPTDRAAIVADLISTADTESVLHIGVGPAAAASSVTYTAGPYRPISEILTELSASYNGFDWRILPAENWNGGVTGPLLGSWTAAPRIGTQQDNAVFEWGYAVNGNVATYTRSTTRDTQADKVYHYTSNGPDAPGFATVSASDAGAISEWGLMEDVAQADIVDAGLRSALVQQHIAVRSEPRQVINFTPHIDPQNTGRLPRFGDDWDIGDTIRARAVYRNSVRIDALMRVWGVSFSLDDSNGMERLTLQLAPDA